MVKTRRQECDRPALKWRKGQRVYSKWKDCKTYPGKVKAVNHDDDTLMIEFDDGIIYRVNAALVSRKLPGAVSSVKQKDDIEKKDVPKPYNIIATSGHTKNSNNQSMDILANEKTQIGNFKENVETNVETNRICNTMGQSEAMDTENDDPTDVTRTNTDFEHLEENNTMLTIATTVTEIANGKENNYVDYTGEITLSSSDEEELDQYYNSESEYKPSKESEASDESDLELNESHFEGSEKDKFNNNETDSETDNSLQNSDVASPQTNANPQKQSAAMAKSDLLSNKQHAEVASCKSFSSIHVMTTSNDVGARKWDKKAYCLYCEKAYSKLTRHLTTMHTNESEVARYLGEADGKKKTAMLCKLRNLGNHVHNCAVLRRGEGSLLVSYRPSKFASAHSYTPCEYCYGYYAKYELWRHKCPLKPVSSTKGKLRQRVLSKSRMLLPTPPEANAALTEVLAAMRSDEVSRVCKSDTLILQLARKETFRVGHEKDSHNYIRSKMRELGRLLVCLRTRTGLYNSSLQDFIEPTKFKDVVEAAQEVSQFNEVTHEYATPSLALKLGHTLKKCAKIMKGNALQCGDVETTTRADAFSTLCELKWTDEVSSHALRTLQLKKRNSVMILPLANDVKVLTKHLQDQTLIRQTILVSETVSMEERKAAWSTLNEITLTQIILFNRRRQGEVSRIEVSQYSKKHAAAQGDIGEMLSTIEQGLCKLFARLEIKGKRGSTVPVLLTSSVQESLDLLIQNRAIAGVDPKNVYLFARSNYGSMGHIRGFDCLQQFSSQCGALHPEHIRSTKLRKHVAAMSQILNLQEQEMDLLAQFMGHDIRVHRQYYRLPEGTLQVAKLSKLLLAMENGTISNNAGKRLEDIDIQPDEEIQHDDDSTESDNESEDENTVMDASKYQPLEREIENIKVAVPRGCSLAKRTSVKRRPWTEEEKAAVMKHLGKQILRKTLPGKKEIENCLRAEPELRHRNWRNVKDFCRNKMLKCLPDRLYIKYSSQETCLQNRFSAIPITT